MEDIKINKKIIYNHYGDSSVMQWKDLPLPSIRDHEVLIRVRAASVNPVDWVIRNGAMKMVTGGKFPKGMGCDVSGVIEKIGTSVSGFNKGDAVFGFIEYKSAQAFGYYAVLQDSLMVRKPQNISFAQAACLPVAGSAAIAALLKKTKIQKGSEILINGCTGGVGSLAVQIAKTHGAQVTGTCNTASIPYARQIGVDTIVDYTEVNILSSGRKFNTILDTSGMMTFEKARVILENKGRYIDLTPKVPGIIVIILKNLFRRKKHLSLITSANKEVLELLAKLSSDGKLKPLIGREEVLEKAIELVSELEGGKKVIGKAVLIKN